jgi:hypothetical protein
LLRTRSPTKRPRTPWIVANEHTQRTEEKQGFQMKMFLFEL